MNIPLILILDIDETILGDNMQTIEYEYLILKQYDDKKLLSMFDIFFKSFLQEKDVFRPYFIDFINFMNKKYKNLEIFLYTNSTYNRIFLLEQILRNKFKFRKIYTRRDSILLQKNILNIFEDICKILNINIEMQKEILKNNIIFIDDVPDILGDYTNKQIVCTEYHYYDYYDLQERFLQTYNIDITKNEKLKKLFNLHNRFYYDKLSVDIEYNDLYLYNLRKLMIQRKNIILKNDDFFLKLIEIIKKHNFKYFNDSNLNKINKLIK
jgi:hypothetical protein